MSSTKRASKNKASPQDNNTVVQTQNKTNYTKTKRTSSTKNTVQNVAEPLGKIANNRHGKKDKASYDRNKDLSNNDSDNENKDDIQQNDDKANNTDGEDDDDDNDNNNNNDEDDVSQSGFSNGSTENWQNKETHNNRNKHQYSHTGLPAEKLLYEDELVHCRRNNTVAMDVQLIKVVLPDLFAVLKFLESDDDLIFNGIICHSSI